jgi:Ferredoxin-dependent bilin reductase
MFGQKTPDTSSHYDLEASFQDLISRVNNTLPLTELSVPPELAQPKSFLKILKARHLNWQAPGFRKVFGMRFDMKLPPLDQMNFIMYPEPGYDTPVFLFFCLLTGRKAICHVNVNCASDSAAYREKWVAPLVAAQAKYGSFECADRYPEWMQKWRTPAGIYGMFPKERFDSFMRCGLEYLDIYLALVCDAQPVSDPGERARISAFQAQFVSDIRTQDKAQGMMAKMIGKETARRIFYEVTT